MAESSQEPKELPRCGLVMPISAIDDCSEEHWQDVLQILSDAVEAAGFRPRLVSTADEVGVIQNRIIQNLYANPVVVCDVSARNPNVMFELGMRLAFDKPTIIVKDRETPFSFDTSSVEHLEYPRDLRFQSIVNFKSELADKIENTHAAATSGADYTTFLGHFGSFKVAKIEETEVTPDQFILEELSSLRSEMRMLAGSGVGRHSSRRSFDKTLHGFELITTMLRDFQQMRGLKSKKSMLEARSEARAFIDSMIDGPVHFDSQSHLWETFDTVFTAMYG